ncbi:MAG: CoA-binding protein [Chloroflexota bacterium]|nr:CoA-binding protein [Chloroflexota bacterium]
MTKVVEKDLVDQLEPIFEPESVAVIGASTDVNKFGGRAFFLPLETGYRGRLYPVNPSRDEVFGAKAYPSVLDIPDAIDLAVIAVAAPLVPRVMEECVEKGVKGVVMITAGFAEAGEQGRRLQDEVVRIAHDAGIRIVGPNCNGIWSSKVKLNLLFSRAPRAGSISFISQSGTLGGYLFEWASNKGYGFAKFVSAGNQASLNTSDYLEYLKQDPDTQAVVLYIEGIQEGQRFVRVAKEVAREKPIVVFKGGRTEVGSRATLSHTASLAGSDEVFDAACKQAGIIRCNEVTHPFDLAEALTQQPLPRGNRVTVVGSGGQCVATADACASLGLELPEFDEDTKRRLMELLPPHASVPTNPVDTAAGDDPMTGPRIVDFLAQVDYIDGIITHGPLIGAGISPERILSLVTESEMVTSIPEKYGKPVICTAVTRRFGGAEFANYLYKQRHIPMYTTPEESARAMWGLARYSEIRRQLAES